MSFEYKNIAIFDQAVASSSPAGSCILMEAEGLATKFPVTIFSSKCEVASDLDINWIKIPLPKGPLFLRYLTFQLLAPIFYSLWRLAGNKAKTIQATQGQFIGADLVYAHFCHRAYLQGPWKLSSVTGLRRVARFLNHSFNAFTENLAFKKASKIIVPSEGLAKEISATYPDCIAKLTVIANPVDLDRFRRPVDFNSRDFREGIHINTDDFVFAFVALGDFARKGLGLLIEATSQLDLEERQNTKFLIVGGSPNEIQEFVDLAVRFKVEEHFIFAGMQGDICPYLWCSDTFVFPSAYETFSLVVFQAAAAGLPTLLASGLHGAGDLIEDGKNGWIIDRCIAGVVNGLKRVLNGRERIPVLAAEALKSVDDYAKQRFVERWLQLYGKHSQ